MLKYTIPDRLRKAALAAKSKQKPTPEAVVSRPTYMFESSTVVADDKFRFLDLPPKIRNRSYRFCVNKTPIKASFGGAICIGSGPRSVRNLQSVIDSSEDEDQRLMDLRIFSRQLCLNYQVNFFIYPTVFLGLAQTC